MMKPLEEWVCDTCAGLIKKPEDGWLEWLGGADGLAHDFRICHHLPASPHKSSKSGCYKHENAVDRMDGHLDVFLGSRGMADLLTFVYENPPGSSGRTRLKDFKSWTEVFKRLHLPHYEEARLYVDEAYADGFFQDVELALAPSQDFLKSIIQEYADDE